MATISLSEQDLKDADAFLTAYLSEKIPEADFSQGSAVRDFVVTAVAFIFAYLEKERQTTRDYQSLLTLAQQTDSEAVSDAVNALLSNWFITRKTGEVARANVTLHFTNPSDITIPQALRFYRTPTLIFVTEQTITLTANQLVPVVDSSGIIVDYTVDVPLVAQGVGVNYNLPPGRFLSVDRFNPYFNYAENQSAILGGTDVESTSALLARAPTAISVRNLVNARSIQTVLQELFPGIERVLTVGFGDPEMLRDFSSEAVTRLQMHVGGHTDIYVKTPVIEMAETGILGAPYARPDGVICRLVDATQDFTAAGVVPGDVLQIRDGLPDSPREYIVNTVGTTELTVSERAAFLAATEDTATYVKYSIGTLSPFYQNKVTEQTNGQTSRNVSAPGTIVLAGRPHYRIKKVEVFPTGTPATVTLLTDRVNLAPANDDQYRIVNDSPGSAQSAKAVDKFEVYMGARAGSWSARVTYETLSNYDSIQSYVVDPFQRVLASDPLVKGYNPVYVQLVVGYRLRVGATSALDTVAVAQSVATYINSFDLTNALDLTGIIQNLRDNFSDVGVVVGIPSLTYTLVAPDGQIFRYRTKDIVTVRPSYPSNNANLINGDELRTPIAQANVDPTLSAGAEAALAAANTALGLQLTALGVSDRTLVYLTTADDITLTQVG